jgi:hypothetical protein
VPDDAALRRRSVSLTVAGAPLALASQAETIAALARLTSLIFIASFVGPAAAQDGNVGIEQQMEQAKRALAIALDERAKRVATEEVPAPPSQQGHVNAPATETNPGLSAKKEAATSPRDQDEERMSAHWWVILGSYPEGASGLDDHSRKIAAAAARCGVRPTRDQSARYEGFAAGYTVLVVGAQPTKASAQKLPTTDSSLRG